MQYLQEIEKILIVKYSKKISLVSHIHSSLVPRPSAPRPFGKLEREKWKEGLVNGLTTACSSAGMLAELIIKANCIFVETEKWRSPVYELSSLFCRQTGLWKPEARARNSSSGVFRRQGCFCSFCLRATANRCVSLVFHTLLTVSSYWTSAEHTDRAAWIYKRFRTSH